MAKLIRLQDDELPPLVILLTHVGACEEALAWAVGKPIGEQSLRDCPSADWLHWIAETLHVSRTAPWERWLSAAKTALSGSGYGYGDGYGDGSGDGYGSGYGDGYGDGSGDGSGDGYGYGYGDGYGDGSGYGYGYGYGYGDGDGDGYGRDIVTHAAA